MIARLPLPAALLLAATLQAASQKPVPFAVDRLPLSPSEALGSFVVEPGYRVELVAAEPLVQSPVAMAFDENGAMYVAENRGYPDPLDGEPARALEGVIARLTDSDGDGRYETRTQFATGLGYPNGVMVWDDGVFVTAAPDLLYLKDTTGDGVADERRVVLTGFNTTNTAQIRFSHPTLAVDNWIYLTAGLNGGTVTAPARPDRPAVAFQGSDSRVNPRTLEFELTGGRSQFCLTFDSAGRRFTCANRQPLWQVILEPWHLARNPAYAFSQTVQEVAAFGAAGTVWPISPDLTTASLSPGGPRHAGTFTAASGAYVHRGDAIVPGQAGSVFICESAQNLVQRQVLAPEGVSFRSRPARDGAEFLASPDTWFRPVFAAGGPDGALYIVDMYRKTIDHPSYVPEASRPAMDFTAGKTRGRIYRIVPSGWVRPRERVALGAASTDALVAALDRPNGWVRDTAQRLIVERQARGAVPGLRARAARPGAPGRIHALWTLDGLGALEPDLVARALSDPDAGVRENALRLAEPRVAASAALADAVLQAAGDAEPRVRLRAALVLGNLPGARAAETLADLAARDATDSWMRAAVFSGISGREDEFFAAVLARPVGGEARRAILKDVAQVVGATAPVDRALELVPIIAGPDAPLGWQAAALEALLDGLERRKVTRDTPSPLRSLIDADTEAARSARQAIDAVFARAAPVASGADASIEDREGAIALVAFDDWARARPRLQALVNPREPGAVQAAAVRALGRLPPAAGAVAWLLEPARLRQYTPQVRDEVLSVVLAREAGVAQLLDAVERGDLDAASIPPARRSRLERHRNDALAARAKALFARAAGAPGGREAYDRLLPAIHARAGVAARGATLFAANCQACHTFKGTGGTTGPDLSGIGAQGPDAILRHILVPDADITAGYETYTVELGDGRMLAGRIESEAPQSLTLRDASAALHTLLRADITAIARAPGSLMPAGFDQALSAQDLTDLIAFLMAP